MAFINLGFEDAGTEPGLALGWTLVSTGLAFQIAAYGTTPPLTSYEGFELEWSNNTYLFAFEPINIDPAVYTLADNKFYEDFEEAWNSNESYVYELLAATAATYDGTPEAFEDFEEDWSSNQSYVYVFAGTAAAYDGTPENFEDFEEDWNSNQSYAYTFSGTAADYGEDPVGYENFEDEEDWNGFGMDTI